MKYLSVILCVSLLAGCASPIGPPHVTCTVSYDPITNDPVFNCSVDVLTLAKTERNLAAARTVSPCNDHLNFAHDCAMAGANSFLGGRQYGRIYDSLATGNNAMAEVVDLNAQSAVLKAQRDAIRQTDKYDLRDLKERQSRENHNGKVMQDGTVNRSMWADVMGAFGHNRKLQPLTQGTNAPQFNPAPDPSPTPQPDPNFAPKPQLPTVK